jgi:hypothetical protein
MADTKLYVIPEDLVIYLNAVASSLPDKTSFADIQAGSVEKWNRLIELGSLTEIEFTELNNTIKALADERLFVIDVRSNPEAALQKYNKIGPNRAKLVKEIFAN